MSLRTRAAGPANDSGQARLPPVPTSYLKAFISSAEITMPSKIQPAGASRRILLVTADTAVREMNASALRAAGYCPDGEGDTEVAWEALCRHGYELLLIYHKLPGESGLRLVLRMSQAHLTLPVVLVLDSPLSFDPRTHHRLHALTILTVPFSAEHLVETVFLTLQGASSTRSVAPRLPWIEAGANSRRHVSRAAVKAKQPERAGRR